MGKKESYYRNLRDKSQDNKIFTELFEFFNDRGVTLQSFGNPESLDFPSNTFLLNDQGSKLYKVNLQGGNFREGTSRIYVNVEYTQILPEDVVSIIERYGLEKEECRRSF